MKSNRKGIALLWVVLTSALILVAILGISMRVVPQKKVENSREYTQRALAVAESGMAAITYDLRTDTLAPSASGPVVLKSYLQSLSVGGSYDSTPVNYDSGAVASGYDSTYQVRIKKTSTGYTFYSLGTVAKPGSTPLARQAITVQYSGNFPLGTYALLSTTTIDLHNGDVIGSVFANTSVTIRDSNGLTGGAAYAGLRGTLDLDPSVPSGGNTNPLISLPNNIITLQIAEWQKFLSGLSPYDGKTVGKTVDYPDTSTPEVKSFLRYSQLILDTGPVTGPVTQTAFETYLNALKDYSTVPGVPQQAGARYLAGFMGKGTLMYYITGGKKGMDSMDLNGLEGTFIIEGDLKLTSQTTIGVDPSVDPNGSYRTAVLVNNGSVTVAAGGASINGLLYINSPTGTAISFTGAGGFTLHGSIVTYSGGIVQKSNGGASKSDATYTFAQNRIYQDYLQESIEEASGSQVSPVPSSWQQISYDRFLAMQ